jgi:dienelactone hydrolase
MTIQVGKKRYNLRDWKQAAKVIESLPEEVRYCSKVITSGYSRGGAIAICLAEALTAQCAIVFAPKRVGMFLPKVLAVHRRGDIVPYLPPWYSKYTFIRRGKWRIFWQAHKEAGKDAAAWRCEAERRPGALITILGGTRALTSL